MAARAINTLPEWQAGALDQPLALSTTLALDLPTPRVGFRLAAYTLPSGRDTMRVQGFDSQPTLSGNTLKLEPLTEGDLEGLYQAAGDPGIWRDHPASDRWKRHVFEEYFASLLATKTALAVIDIHSGLIVGTSSYYTPPDRPDSIAIGFTFLVREKWGGSSNHELKQLMLEHAFKTFDTVFFHIAASNIRSQKATLKIGAVHLYDADLNLSASLRPWKCYGLTRTQWAQGSECPR